MLLRAVNGAPSNRLTMVDLRRCIEQCGFVDVTTYLQTGNVVLRHPLGGSPGEIAARLDEGLARTGLVRADAVVWRPTELLTLVAGDPFADRYPLTHWRRCASFLCAPPGARR